MGRGKIDIKRIENTANRKVTFNKRKAGLLKKAKEIAVLCEAKVSVMIVDHKGTITCDCSPNTSLSQILDEYHKHSKDGIRLWDAKHENINSEIERVKKENENMNIKLKHLKGEDIQSLNHIELMTNENLLENGLICIRERKAEVIKELRESSEILEEEHSRLHYELAQMELRELRGLGEICNSGYQHQEMKEYNIPQMPFSFKVQPMQPNLQDMRM